MEFDNDILLDIVKGKTRGDFEPFTTGKWKKTEQYLRTVTGRLKDIRAIDLKADYNHYGSGFSSYIHIYISKRDKSDTVIDEKGDLRTETTNGLMLYLCRMTPIAVFSSGDWSTTFRNDKWQSASNHYIEPNEIGTTPRGDWSEIIVQITDILNQYGIRLMTREELDVSLDIDIQIPTILSDPPYRLFDCFFYWED